MYAFQDRANPAARTARKSALPAGTSRPNAPKPGAMALFQSKAAVLAPDRIIMAKIPDFVEADNYHMIPLWPMTDKRLIPGDCPASPAFHGPKRNAPTDKELMSCSV